MILFKNKNIVHPVIAPHVITPPAIDPPAIASPAIVSPAPAIALPDFTYKNMKQTQTLPKF